MNYDMDRKTQIAINKIYSDLPIEDWNNWKELYSSEEYLEYILKISGLDGIEDIYKRIKLEKTSSTTFSVNLETALDQVKSGELLILCHTSGTTNSNNSGLKWFQIKSSNVKRSWAPGMKAIFESSGLKSTNSAVIFVPSRLKNDGYNNRTSKKYISLYSSEFSQRIMLSLIKPWAYSFFEYKNALNLDVLSKILSLENIAVLSAPAVTILKWADINKFMTGIEQSIKSFKGIGNSQVEGLYKIIKENNLKKAAKIIQNQLSEKMKDATLVFSISSLTENDWILIRKFMGWKKGYEKFTNLYVVSEVGPIASSLGDFKVSRLNQMYMIPLSLPVLEKNRKRMILTDTIVKLGKLLISRMEENKPLINIDIGDIIKVESSESLPLIGGKILRNSFSLKYPVHYSQKIPLPKNYELLAGDYFELEELKFHKSREVLECINNIQTEKIDSFLLLISKGEKKLYLPLPKNNFNIERILECIKAQFNSSQHITLKFLDEKPLYFVEKRSIILDKVRAGKIPKGILKKWPIYVLKDLD